MPPARSLPRRLAYVAVVLVVVLGAAELGLRLYTRSLEPPPLPPMQGELALLCFGDSVTEGFGMERKELAAWPVQLHDQLLAEGVGTVEVYNLARSGAGTRQMVEDMLPRAARSVGSVRPVGVLMSGHNEFIEWRTYERGLDDGSVTVTEPMRPKPRLALLRVAEWALGAVEGDAPTVVLDPRLREVYRQRLATLRDWHLEHGGRFWLATYAIPGEPTPDLSEKEAYVLRRTRSGQALINQEIRAAAEALDVPLVDVETELGSPAVYDHAWFIDNIHLTREGLGRLATLVRTRLQDAGDLPHGDGTAVQPLTEAERNARAAAATAVGGVVPVGSAPPPKPGAPVLPVGHVSGTADPQPVPPPPGSPEAGSHAAPTPGAAPPGAAAPPPSGPPPAPVGPPVPGGPTPSGAAVPAGSR